MAVNEVKLLEHDSVMEHRSVTEGDTEEWVTPGGITYEAVRFNHIDAEETNSDDTTPSNAVNFIVIGAGLWRNLGSPRRITVTVEGGDTLNEVST